MKTRDELIAELVSRRIWQVRNLIREEDNLSEPVPSGHWRWADHGRTREEQAEDQARARVRAAELREELEILLNG